MLELLLKNGADVNAASSKAGATPLVAAADCGHTEIVKLLLQHGADINATTIVGTTPLAKASKMGHMDIVCVLLDNGVDINVSGLNERTALLHAADAGETDIVCLLIERGADVTNRSPKSGRTRSVLVAAARRGFLNMTRILVQKYNLDVNVANHDGLTPLRIAVSWRQADVAQFLLKCGSNPDAANPHDRSAPLMVTVRNGDVKIPIASTMRR